MTSPNASPALLLNADFRPLGIYPLKLLPWQDAVKAVLLERVCVVEEYDVVVRSPGSARNSPVEMRLPSVVALREFQRQDRPVAFTRIGLFIRDRFTCGYCDRRFPMRDLTFDHLVPQCRGGRTVWGNIVTACAPCNAAKGSKSVKEAGLILRRPPFVPTRWQLNDLALECQPTARAVHHTWRAYLGLPDQVTVEESARVTEDAGTGLAFPNDMTSEAYWEAELDEG